MIRFRKILCPVDFSPASLRAFDYALKFAKSHGARVHALHVVEPVMGAAYVVSIGAQSLAAEFEREAKRVLLKLKAKAAKAGVRVDTDVRVGDIDLGIRLSVDAQKADLVIMGSHGRRGFKRLVLGSVTERMIRHSAVPVMIIGPGRRPGSAPSPVRSILVTTDFSDGTSDAVELALSIAKESHAKVTLLHVVHDIAADIVGHYREALLGGVEVQLRKLVPARGFEECEVETRVGAGLPSRIIANMIKYEKFDLLVMNIHGKDFLDHAFIGSTAERSLRAAAEICPVLLIPRKPAKRPGKTGKR